MIVLSNLCYYFNINALYVINIRNAYKCSGTILKKGKNFQNIMYKQEVRCSLKCIHKYPTLHVHVKKIARNFIVIYLIVFNYSKNSFISFLILFLFPQVNLLWTTATVLSLYYLLLASTILTNLGPHPSYSLLPICVFQAFLRHRSWLRNPRSMFEGNMIWPEWTW